MKKGDRVSYSDRGHGSSFHAAAGAPTEWTGRIAATEKNRVLLELDEPIPFYLGPEAVDIEAIDDRMYLPKTKTLAYGLADALEDAGLLPPGKRDQFNTIYQLDDPMSIKKIKEFCEKKYRGQKHCWLHGIMMTAVPIDLKSKWFGEFKTV